MSPEFPLALVPITICEEIASGPSDKAVQFGPKPNSVSPSEVIRGGGGGVGLGLHDQGRDDECNDDQEES